MTSKLYTSKELYTLEKKKKIGTHIPRHEKLFKNSKGEYYIYNKTSHGKTEKVYLKENDKVYSRGNSISPYEKSQDRKRTAKKIFASKKKWAEHKNQGDYKNYKV